MDDRTSTDAAATFDLGVWIGRGQAFSFVVHHCSAAQAECLTRIRKEGLYKALNLTWDEFCEQHAGASRAHADDIIRRLEEFGAAYFRLSEIVRISPQSYRAMQAAVKGEALEVGGESIPITPENASKIREAIAALRAELRSTQDAQSRYSLGITQLKDRLDAWVDDMSSLNLRLDVGERAALQGLIRYTLKKIKTPGPGSLNARGRTGGFACPPTAASTSSGAGSCAPVRCRRLGRGPGPIACRRSRSCGSGFRPGLC